MTTTPELHELAKDPQAFDIVRARLDDERGKYAREISQATARLHELAGDRKSYRNTPSPVWGLSDREVTTLAQRAAAHDDQSARVVLTSMAAARAMLEAIDHERGNMDMVYMGQGNRWTRFFPSVTKSQPHIHRSLSCHTLHATTVMQWAPELSGHTDEEAVAKLDEALCSVCFPTAPVALHNYVSRRSQAEQAARQAEKETRNAVKSAKQLTEAEQFRTVGTFKELVETVAKCKELVREPSKALAELEWTRANGSRVWTDPADLERVLRNREATLAKAEMDAQAAEAVLVAREVRQEGTGATEADIARMRATALKNARREWAKN